MKKIFSAVVLMLLCAMPVFARPVSYSGGWMAMQMNDGENNSLSIDYSPTAFYSVGYLVDYWREDRWLMHAGAVNWLTQRWNSSDLQANFYVRSGLGIATSDYADYDDEVETAGFIGTEFDVENRRHYFSYENKWTEAGKFGDAFQQRGRVGIAPYIAEYGSLHTWIMLQVDHRPESEDALTWTPMVRVFQGDVMFEFGISDAGEILFNTILQF